MRQNFRSGVGWLTKGARLSVRNLVAKGVENCGCQGSSLGRSASATRAPACASHWGCCSVVIGSVGLWLRGGTDGTETELQRFSTESVRGRNGAARQLLPRCCCYGRRCTGACCSARGRRRGGGNRRLTARVVDADGGSDEATTNGRGTDDEARQKQRFDGGKRWRRGLLRPPLPALFGGEEPGSSPFPFPWSGKIEDDGRWRKTAMNSGKYPRCSGSEN